MKIKHKKLKEWVSAGIIGEDVANRIHDYEENRQRGRFGRGLGGAAVFAILIGILSIIASNWHQIPGEVKIGAHVLVNFAVGLAALYADRRGHAHFREGAALAFIGLTMTLIVLIGQVYQMDGTVAGATLFWMIITLPFFHLMGRTRITAAPWVLAFLATVALNFFEHFNDIPLPAQPASILGVTALLPLILVGAGSHYPLQQKFAALAESARGAGVVLLTLFASIGLASYGFLTQLESKYIILFVYYVPVLIAGAALLAFHAKRHDYYRQDALLKFGALFVGVSFAAQFIPLLLLGTGGTLVAALLFIAYWIFIGWIAQNLGLMRIVSFAVTIIAIRIFIVYIELFGTLLSTGAGLIVGGVVMLALIRGARSLNRRLTKGENIHA